MKLFKKFNLNKNEKLLLIISCLYALTGIFTNTFIIARFVQLTNDNLKTICLFYIIVFLTRSIGALFMGTYIKNFPNRKHKAMNFGLIIRALYVFAVVLLKDNIVKYYYLLAVIFAISEMCYHFASDTISIDITSLDNRAEYNNIKNILKSTITFIVPVVLGTTIELKSFNSVGIYMAIFCLIACIICYFIEIKEYDYFYDYENEENNLKDDFTPIIFLKRVVGDKLSLVTEFYTAATFYGLFEYVFQVLFIYSFMLNFKSIFALGIAETVLSIFSLFSISQYHKYHNKHGKEFLIICCILIFISSISLMYDITSKIAVIIFGIGFFTANSIFSSMFATCKGNVSNNYNLRNYSAEYMTFQTLYQNLGRTFSFGLILFAALTGLELLYKVALVFIGFFGIACGTLLYFIIKEIGTNRFK